MKKIALTISTIMLGLSFQSLAANPQFNNDQLRQFHETNRCPNCDLSGYIFEENDVNHSGATLHDVNFSNAQGNVWPGVNFAFSNLVSANFTGAELPNANFSNADVSHAHFDGANLMNANFFGANGFDPRNANICNAILPDGSKGKCEEG